jgi:hypothetical protein
MGVTPLDILINIGLVVIVALLDLAAESRDNSGKRVPAFFSILFYSVLFILIMGLGKFYSGGQFIYFQF